jgi:peptidyl-prolyl cis-trans isomerase SurA
MKKKHFDYCPFRPMLTLLTSLFILALPTAAFSITQPLDHIIAAVNDDIITQSEFNEALQTAQIERQVNHLPIPPTSQFRQQVLDELIDRTLQLQLAKQAGVKITDAELNQAIHEIAVKNHLAVNDFYERLHQEGLSTNRYRQELRQQLVLHKLQQHEVASRITITSEEVASYQHPPFSHIHRIKAYHVEDIMIPLNGTASATDMEQAKKQAAILLTRLKHGQHPLLPPMPADVHITHHDLGWRTLSEIPSAFVGYLSQMQVKEVAGPIQTGNGLHIIRLIGVQGESLTRQQAEDLVLQRKFADALQTWMSKLRGQAFIVTDLS